MNKLNVAVIFGGTNTEHEVSIVSARSVINHLDPEKYNAIGIYITKQNQWAQLMPAEAAELPSSTETNLIPADLTHQNIDVIFPVLHGPYGEDGTIQGMLEMLRLPYVGCGVLASALCMDKVVQKQLCLQQGLMVTPFVWTDKNHWDTNPSPTLQYITNKLHYPLFVKPARQGSSVGITKVHTQQELIPAIQAAFQFDTKIIIEQGVPRAREIECAVLGNDDPKVSVLGEINPSNEFYDYDAKYVDGKSEAHIPADLPKAITEKIQTIAYKSFKLLNCSGPARVDFLVDSQTMDIYLNELNTMPGFTSISMYPKLWEASGLPYNQLLDQLITLGLERWQQQSNHLSSLSDVSHWYRK